MFEEKERTGVFLADRKRVNSVWWRPGGPRMLVGSPVRNKARLCSTLVYGYEWSLVEYSTTHIDSNVLLVMSRESHMDARNGC